MEVSLTDTITYKRLVAVGNDKVYYEDIDVSAGTMIELTTTGNAIDTSDQLNIFEGYQKAFVVNGEKLKIIDFVNTKINTTDAGVNPCHKGNTLTGGTSTASMIVDYVDGVTDNAAMNVYGYRTTTATFSSGETVTGTNDNGNAISFVLSAAETPPPHWYNWTVFGNDTTTYGTMPAKAYLGCLYRGRAILAGNPNYPYQWYMSRVGDTWDWLYAINDPLSPVRGGNSDAGEIGDIIRALISYKDDYLIFGCATSIWVMRGDPCSSGSLDEVDLTVGIFGAKSWCFDGAGNLYFYGTGGIYKLPVGFAPIENLTAISLPELITDESADSSSHRITMEYDRKGNGLFISITKLADGTNSCYWYDLQLKAFYPENYPEECGAYSLFYYDANDPVYRDLLIGCKDGYIRKFDSSKKNDDIGGTDEAINSYCALPVIFIGNLEEDKEGRLNSLVFELAGGASGGSFSDTDAVSYAVYVGDDAETVIEDIKDGATAFATGILTGTGRKTKISIRARAMYIGIKLYNSTVSQTWVVNRILGEVKPVGKMR